MGRLHLGAFTALALALAGQAGAAEITRVASRGEPGKPFEMHVTLRWDRLQERARITREVPCCSIPSTWPRRLVRSPITSPMYGSGVTTSKEGQSTIARAFHSARKGRRSTLDLEYLVASPEGIEHLRERHVMGLFTPSEYRRALERAGLRVVFYKRGLMGRGLFVGLKRLEREG